jgi:hypothetical protein
MDTLLGKGAQYAVMKIGKGRAVPVRKILTNLVVISLAVLVLPGVADTLILQQGQDGYAGCTDSYVRADGYTTGNGRNYGTYKQLHVRNEHYNGG